MVKIEDLGSILWHLMTHYAHFGHKDFVRVWATRPT